MSGPALTDAFASLISDRANSIDVSGIRRVFELGAKLESPINLSIGQPDFPVPDQIKRDTIAAIENDCNGYALTQGRPELISAIRAHLREDIGWNCDGSELDAMVTSGTSGAILAAFMTLLNPGDEIVIGDPYFVIYPALTQLCGATPVYCDTYPDFRMTAARLEPLLNDRTKMVLLNSPSNPSGIVLTEDEVKDVAKLCEERGVMLLSDEIYDEFTFEDARVNGRCPSPARYTENCLLVRGFGKTYGCTGWRLGYMAGPTTLIRSMMKIQQYTYVCAPSMAQVGIAGAFDIDMDDVVARYARRRDAVLDVFKDIVDVRCPGGAFYVFVPVPESLGISATEFAERAVERNVLVIPGGVFSQRDTHVRISIAADDDRLLEGATILRELMNG